MARGKPRSPKNRIAGSYAIDSGTARFLPDPDRDGGYTLEVNNVPSSYIALGAPRILGFDYLEWMATAMKAAFPREDVSLSAAHLGAAGCSLPRYCADVWPASRHLVVDIDGRLLDLVADKVELPAPPRVELAVADARAAVQSLPVASTDVVVRDVFAGASTPRHVTTVGFFRDVSRALTSSGLYLANVGDHAGLRETGAELAGMLEIFPHVGAIADADMLAGRGYGNVVLYGAQPRLAVDQVGAALDASFTTAHGTKSHPAIMHRGTQSAQDMVNIHTPARYD